ncbi:MAG: hypothetical protein ACK4E3_08745 [Brevundimonas sp.]|uniref:hypothetical protein n=1 Tax=Brevundimonas sp. TaxID=1871086 RepID=UPI003918ABF5
MMRRNIGRGAMVAVAALMVATPALAQQATRFYSYDPANDEAQRMTRGITLEVRRGLFGASQVQRFYSTEARGSAELERVSTTAPLRALPAGAGETNVYRIAEAGDGRALGRALCPGTLETWLVIGRVRARSDIRLHAVGRTEAGEMRLCRTMSYTYRGEWSVPSDLPPPAAEPLGNPPSR